MNYRKPINKKESQSHVSRMLITTIGIAIAIYVGKLKALKLKYDIKDEKFPFAKVRSAVTYFSTIPLRKRGGPDPINVP